MITGGGTANVIPQFTSPTSVGDSPISTEGPYVGIGIGDPWSPLTVGDFRETDRSGNQPNAIYVVSNCPLANGCSAVRGESYGSAGAGLVGVNYASFDNGPGFGIVGTTYGTDGLSAAVRGDANGVSGVGVAIFGQSSSQQGIAGLFINRAMGNIIVGQVGAEGSEKNVFRVNHKGTVYADGGFRPFGADFAESMAVAGDQKQYEPGDLLVIDRSGDRRLALTNTAYSTLVAGIYSTKPGVLASQHEMDDPNIAKEVPMAVVGIVPCKVSTENGAIEVGDLLVTSATPGYAMKGTDRTKMLGAVVGKALEPLHEGKGLIHVLVTLQ